MLLFVTKHEPDGALPDFRRVLPRSSHGLHPPKKWSLSETRGASFYNLGDTMARDWESNFIFWARSPSKTEEQRSENAIGAIRNAVNGSSTLKQRKIKVFTQGSYRNRVNVRQDSDVDVGVMLYEYFLSQYPERRTGADFGVVDAGYSFSQFKNELEEALLHHFGRAAVKRGNKAFNIRENTYHVEADVVPLFEFRRYWESGNYRAGVALVTDQGRRIENYPERLVESWPPTPLHYENGNFKNTNTSRRYRGLVRILKKIRNQMEDAGSSSAKAIPGYLVECLCWNVPNAAFAGSTWDVRVQAALGHLWTNTKDDASYESWCEVDDIKYLFRASQPWTRAAAHAFIDKAWDYVGVGSS